MSETGFWASCSSVHLLWHLPVFMPGLPKTSRQHQPVKPCWHDGQRYAGGVNFSYQPTVWSTTPTQVFDTLARSNRCQDIPLFPLSFLLFFQSFYHSRLICLCFLKHPSGIHQMQLSKVITLHPGRKMSLNAYPLICWAWPWWEVGSWPLWVSMDSPPLAECTLF